MSIQEREKKAHKIASLCLINKLSQNYTKNDLDSIPTSSFIEYAFLFGFQFYHQSWPKLLNINGGKTALEKLHPCFYFQLVEQKLYKERLASTIRWNIVL